MEREKQRIQMFVRVTTCNDYSEVTHLPTDKFDYLVEKEDVVGKHSKRTNRNEWWWSLPGLGDGLDELPMMLVGVGDSTWTREMEMIFERGLSGRFDGQKWNATGGEGKGKLFDQWLSAGTVSKQPNGQIERVNGDNAEDKQGRVEVVVGIAGQMTLAQIEMTGTRFVTRWESGWENDQNKDQLSKRTVTID